MNLYCWRIVNKHGGSAFITNVFWREIHWGLWGFYCFSSINESECMHDWLMLVLYLASIVVSSVVSLFVLVCNCLSLLEQNPMPSEFQLYVPPFPGKRTTTTFALGIPKCPVIGMDIFWNHPMSLCGNSYSLRFPCKFPNKVLVLKL